MRSKIIFLLVFLMCAMLLVGCSPKINIKDDEGNVEVSVDAANKDDKVDINVKTEDGDTLNISAEEGGEWPASDLPKRFPEFKGGSINGTTVTASDGFKVTMIVFTGGTEEDYKKYAEIFEEDGYFEILKSEDDDGFMWVQQKKDCCVTVAYTKSTEGGMITVQVEE